MISSRVIALILSFILPGQSSLLLLPPTPNIPVPDSHSQTATIEGNYYKAPQLPTRPKPVSSVCKIADKPTSISGGHDELATAYTIEPDLIIGSPNLCTDEKLSIIDGHVVDKYICRCLTQTDVAKVCKPGGIQPKLTLKCESFTGMYNVTINKCDENYQKQIEENCKGVPGAATPADKVLSKAQIAQITGLTPKNLSTIDSQTEDGQYAIQKIYERMNISPTDAEKIVNQNPQRALDLLNAMAKGDEPVAQSIAKEFSISPSVIKSNMGTIESASTFPAAGPSASVKSAAPSSPVGAPAVAPQTSARGPYITSSYSPDNSASGSTWWSRNWAYVLGGGAVAGLGIYALLNWTSPAKPTLTLYVQPQLVSRGSTVVASWSSKETSSCFVTQNYATLGYGTSGSASVPTSTTTPSSITILLQCISKNDNQTLQQTTVVAVQ